jgi:hypothetical protein
MHIFIGPSMYLAGLSLEIYIIHFVAQLRDCITREPSDQSSHICRWKGLGLERVLKTGLVLSWHYSLRQIEKKVSKFLN